MALGMVGVNAAVKTLLAGLSGFANTSVQDSGTATGGAASTLTDSSKAWTVNEWADATLTITGGTGSGQTRTVTSNTATALTVGTAWTTNPGATSTYQLTRPNVFDYDPIFVDADKFPYAVVDVTASDESRRGWTDEPHGAGKKYVKHAVRVMVHDESAEPATTETAFRTLLDAIRTVFRANQTLAGGQGILRFGEDIKAEFDRSFGSGDMTSYDAIVTSEAWEEIDG